MKKLKSANVFTILRVPKEAVEDLYLQIGYMKKNNLLKDEMELTVSKNGPVYCTFFPTRESMGK